MLAATFVLVAAAVATAGAPAIDPRLLVPPPPAIGGQVEAVELAELRRIARARSAAELAWARRDGATKDGSIFAGVLGPAFDLAHLPATARLLDRVRAEEKAAAKLGKAEFHRPRPWTRAPGLGSCSTSGAQDDSYPSGHATMAYAMAVTLTAILPERADGLLARAAVYARSRLVCGQHFPSDVVAGQVLGTVVAETLLLSPEVQSMAIASRTELESAGVVAHAGAAAVDVP